MPNTPPIFSGQSARGEDSSEDGSSEDPVQRPLGRTLALERTGVEVQWSRATYGGRTVREGTQSTLLTKAQADRLYSEGGAATGIEVIQLDASGGNVNESLPEPSDGAARAVSRVDDTTNTATLETADPSAQEIRFPQGKDASSVDLRPEQSLLLTADGTHWYVEEGQGLRAEAEDVTSDGGTKESPRLTQTATYDSDTSSSVTSSDVSIERYVRTDVDGNAVLVYESNGTEIARLSDGGRFETRKDQEAFMSGSLNAGQGTNSLLQVEDGSTVYTTDAASLTFVGAGVSVSQPNPDEIELDISGGSGSATDVLAGGTEVVADASDIDFAGGDFSVTDEGSGEAGVALASSLDVDITGDADTLDGTHLADITFSDTSMTRYTDSEALSAVNDDSDHGSTAQHNYYTDADAVDALQAHDGTNVDADTLDGYEGSDLAALAEDETVTGAWTFDGSTGSGWPFQVNVGSGDAKSGNVAEWIANLCHDGTALSVGVEEKQGTDAVILKATPVDSGDDRPNLQIGATTSPAIGIGTQGEQLGVQEVNPNYALEVSGDARATGEVEAFLGSDKRLKTELNPLNSALDKVEALTGYGFDWDDKRAVQPHKRGKQDVGLLAQEVEDVLPEAVQALQGGHSDGYKGVSYDKLVPLLVEAIKDLRSQVNGLRN